MYFGIMGICTLCGMLNMSGRTRPERVRNRVFQRYPFGIRAEGPADYPERRCIQWINNCSRRNFKGLGEMIMRTIVQFLLPEIGEVQFADRARSRDWALAALCIVRMRTTRARERVPAAMWRAIKE